MNDLQNKDLPALEKWFHEKSTLWVPPSPVVEGKSRVIAMLRKIFSRYTALHWNVEAIYEVTPTTVIYFTDSWGMLCGKDYKNKIATIMEFTENGEYISSISDYFKDTHVFHQ